MHCAGAALRQPAAKMKPVQAKLVTQRIQQRHIGIVRVQDARLAIDGQLDGSDHDSTSAFAYLFGAGGSPSIRTRHMVMIDTMDICQVARARAIGL